jgi:hypothetical protein
MASLPAMLSLVDRAEADALAACRAA